MAGTKKQSSDGVRTTQGEASNADSNPTAPDTGTVASDNLRPLISRSALFKPVYDALQPNRDHYLLYTITGIPGSGRTAALDQIIAQATQQGFRFLYIDLPDLIEQFKDQPTPVMSCVYDALKQIAILVGIGLSQLSEQASKSAIQALANKVQRAIESDPDLRLLLTFDNADENDTTRDVVREMERGFFVRLEDTSRSSLPTIIVVASCQPLKWPLLYGRLTHITLTPFNQAQTIEQLGCTPQQARAILAISGGLPGANELVWKLYDGGNGITLTKEVALYDAVYDRFVAPLIKGCPPEMENTIKATALLDHAARLKPGLRRGGFDADQYRATVREISYTTKEHQHSTADFYAHELGQMSDLRLISRDERDSRYYHMEQHLTNLLYCWNKYKSTRQFKENDERAKVIVGRSTSPAIQPLPGEPQRVMAFTGRNEALEEIRGWVARRPALPVNTVLIQGKPGSGKTALVNWLLGELGKDKELTDLVIPVFVGKLPDEPAFSGKPALIDLEFGPLNRLSLVRTRIIEALRGPLGGDVDKSFREYINTRDKLDNLRGEIKKRKDPPVRIQATGQEQARIRQLYNDLEEWFNIGCTRIAGEGEHERKRIVLAFDTYDYPVRSGHSATQLVNQIIGHVAGDFFVIIACRTSIKIEDAEVKPYLTTADNPARTEQPKRNAESTLKYLYLPYNLREQVEVIDLDDENHNFERADIVAYYEKRPWYVVGGAASANLAQKMAEVIAENDYIPVLFNLLEFYGELTPAGLTGKNESDFERIAGRFDELLAAIRADKQNRSTGKPRQFGPMLIKGLLEGVLYNDHYQDEGRRALLAMSMIDTGLSKGLLRYIANSTKSAFGTNDAPYSDYDTDSIWLAVERIAADDARNTSAGQGRDNLITSTLVKQVSSFNPQDETSYAYKLHDYVSGLFESYIERLKHSENLTSEEQDWARSIVAERELVVRAAFDYFCQMGNEAANELEAGQDDANFDYHTPLRAYQIARAAQLYYALKLAAVRLKEGKVEDADEEQAFSLGDVESVTKSALRGISDQSKVALQDIIDQSKAALTVARATFRYLLHEVLQNIGEFAEVGYSETLLQQVRYFLYNQDDYSDESGQRVANLTLPLFAGKHQDLFAEVRQLYYAAQLVWEHNTGNYVNGLDWTEQDRQGAIAALDAAATKQGMSYLLVNIPRTKDEYLDKHWDGLYESGYSEQAYHLAQQRLDRLSGNDKAALLIKMAQLVTNNPRNGGTRGINQALVHLWAAERVAASPYWQARAYFELGFAYRLLNRLDAGTTEDPHSAVGCYLEAIKLASRLDGWEAKLLESTSLSGCSYVRALIGQYQAADSGSQKGIDGLDELLLGAGDNQKVKAEIILTDVRAYSAKGEVKRLEARASEASTSEPLYVLKASGNQRVKKVAEARLEETKEDLEVADKCYEYAQTLLRNDERVYNSREGLTWRMTLDQQKAINTYRRARVEGKRDRNLYEKLLETIIADYPYCDGPRRLDAIRRICILLKAIIGLLADESERASEAKRTELEGKIKEYYKQAREFYDLGVDKAVAAYDSFNATRLVLEAIELIVAQEGVAKARTFYAEKRELVERILPLGNRLQLVLDEFAESSIRFVPLKEEVKKGEVSEGTLNRFLQHLLVAPIIRVEEEADMSGYLRQVIKWIEEGRLDNHLDSMYNQLKDKVIKGDRQRWVLDAIALRQIEPGLGMRNTPGAYENRPNTS